MDAARLYDIHAAPHLPKDGAYGRCVRDTFAANAATLVEWVVDASSAMLGEPDRGLAFPMETFAGHVLSAATDFPGRGLTSAVPFDRLAAMVGEGEPARFGRMMVGLMALHLVRAADAVAVGIANASLGRGSRIDVTGHGRGMLTRALAERAADTVVDRIAADMPRIDAIAYAAAASWTRATLH